MFLKLLTIEEIQISAMLVHYESTQNGKDGICLKRLSYSKCLEMLADIAFADSMAENVVEKHIISDRLAYVLKVRKLNKRDLVSRIYELIANQWKWLTALQSVDVSSKGGLIQNRQSVIDIS